MENTVPYEPDSEMRTWTLDDRTTTDITSVGPNVCSTCADLHSQQTQTRHSPPSLPFLKTPEGHPLSLVYQTEDEGDLLQEVVSAGVRLDDRPPLTAGFLLCMCVQSSSVRLRKSDLRRLLLLIASGVQSTMWVSLSGEFHWVKHQICACSLVTTTFIIVVKRMINRNEKSWSHQVRVGKDHKTSDPNPNHHGLDLCTFIKNPWFLGLLKS